MKRMTWKDFQFMCARLRASGVGVRLLFRDRAPRHAKIGMCGTLVWYKFNGKREEWKGDYGEFCIISRWQKYKDERRHR